MPNNKRSLGNRLANISAHHREQEKNWRKTLRNKLTKERSSEPVYSLGHGIPSQPVYSILPPDPVYNKIRTWSSAPPTPKKNCGMKPPQFIGTKKNPAFNEWKKCNTEPAVGGKRKTRRAKKSRRATRRRR